MLLDFLKDLGNYEERKVERFEKDALIVDTCAISDADKPYETAIRHTFYNEGKWVVVELYSSKEEAKKGHNKWVEIMTTENLPAKLVDKSTTEISFFLDSFDESWRTYKREVIENVV